MKRRVWWFGTAAAMLTLLVSAVGAAAALPIVTYVPDTEQDASVSTATAPATAGIGDFALLSSIVTNHGSTVSPIGFTDSVPAGLTITSAAAGSGSCTTSGQTVACNIRLEPAESAPVDVVVTPTATGSFENRVSVAPAAGFHDPVSSNNSATATLTVAAAAAPSCSVPALKRTPVSVAKKVLMLLNCKPGKAIHAHNRSILRGQVIKTVPKPGTYANGKVVSLTVSSGPAKAKKKHKR